MTDLLMVYYWPSELEILSKVFLGYSNWLTFLVVEGAFFINRHLQLVLCLLLHVFAPDIVEEASFDELRWCCPEVRVELEHVFQDENELLVDTCQFL